MLYKNWILNRRNFAFTLLIISATFLLFVVQAQAAISLNVATKVFPFGQGIKASSVPTAVVGLNVASSSETLTSVTVHINGLSLFSTTTDLAPLSTTASSGVALYKDNKSSGQPGRFDGTDTLVTLSSTPSWVSGVTTILTIATPEVVPINDTGANTGSDYFVVVRTASGAVEGHAFTVSIEPGNIGYSASTPTTTPILLTTNTFTIDTTPPNIDFANTGPSNNATNVPVSAFINVAFSENIDTNTINASNITFTTGGTPVGVAFRTMPNAVNMIVSDPPTYASASHFAKFANTTFGFYNIFGSSPIMPFGSYTTPTAGDIVYFQHNTFPTELGIITNATMTSGVFAVNNSTLVGGQAITKLATPAKTGAVTASTALSVGDLIVANTQTNPINDRYALYMVTTGGAVNGSVLRLNGASAAPGYKSGSSFSTITPQATSTINSSSQLVQGMDFVKGDIIFAKITAGGGTVNTYAWHVVTTAETVGTTATSITLRLDDSASTTVFAVNSVVSKLTPSVHGVITDTTTPLSSGDVILANTTANAAQNGSYALHIVSSEATGASSNALRFDNSTTNLAVGSTYIITVGTGVTDQAGNALTTPQTITFTTGSTGSTNTTPPFVTSSNPTNGTQEVPTNTPIKIVFSQDMAIIGTGSVFNSSNVGIYGDTFGAPGTAVSASHAYDATTRTLTLTPASALTANTSYILKVANTTKSEAGTAMNEFFATFRTSLGADTVKPTVLGIFPSTGATAVPRNQSAISIGFSEDIDPSTITASTITVNNAMSGTVTYDPASRTAFFSPTVPFASNTLYTVTVTTGVADLSGNQLNTNYTSAFTTASAADTVSPTIVAANADNFGIAVTFSEAMKSGGGPNAVDNISNYTIESPLGSSIALGGKTVTYNGPTMTAKINGLSLQNGNTFKVTVAHIAQDISGNAILTTGTPAANTARGSVEDASQTGGQLGPGSGPQQDAGLQGMSPIRVTPKNKSAGASSGYSVEFPVSTAIPSGGSIVLTFPTGFDVSSASAVANSDSFSNRDLNGPQSGTVTIAGVTKSASSRTVTVTTGGAATGANTFIALDLKGIVNSTIPSSVGYTVDIKTRDTSANSNAVLETKTSAPFFLGQTGANTLTVQIFHDDNTNNTNDSGEGIGNAQVFLFSPASGGTSATSNSSGVATFSSLPNGDYMLGIDPSSVGSYSVNPAPQPVTISGNTVKKYALGASGSTITISGTVIGTASTKIDVFAMSPNGFTKKTITLTGGADTYSLPVQADTAYKVGVGPAIPASFMAPGALPPPPPTFTFMPPENIEVAVGSSSITGKNFVLTSASKTITGTVLDSSGSGVNGARIFARPVSNATAGGDSVGFGTGGQTDSQGQFTVNVVPGVYLVAVSKPGMPSVAVRQITVPITGTNSPSVLSFKMNATTGITITGSIKDDSGNAIPYAGISARKVTSTSDTSVIGGGTQNFLSGQSDSNGVYTLYVDAGTWMVEAYAPGFGRLGTKTVTVSSTSLTGQDFSAQTLSLGTITGQASKAGVVQQGVSIRAEGPNGANMVTTDSSGNYSLKVPVGTYTVSCLFPDIGESTPLTSIAVTQGSTNSGNNCTVSSPITITVNLTDGTNPITNAYVDVRDANGRGNGTNISVASSTDAVYTITVPPGTYTVRAGHAVYGEIGTTANVNSTRTISYTATAGERYAVTGTVKVGSSALSNAWVSVIGIPTGQTNTINIGAQTASNGTFSVSVPAGSYRIRADKPGYQSPADTTITVSGATSAGTISLTAATQTITGTATISGVGVSGAFVDATDGSGGFAVAQTDATGAYSLAVGDGTWTVRAHSLGYEGGPLSVAVSGNSPTGQTVALTAISGFTVTQERQETITPSAGGLLTNTDIGSNFKMNIPANALGTGSNAGTIKTQNNTAIPTPSSGVVLSKNAVKVSAVDSSGQPIKNLNSDVVLVVPYTQSDIPSGQTEGDLVLGVWNEANKVYDSLPTIVDTVANTLTATVSHFSDFVPMFSANTPTVSSSSSSSSSSSGGGGGAPVPAGYKSPNAVTPRAQIVYPDGRVVYLDEQATSTLAKANTAELSNQLKSPQTASSVAVVYTRSLSLGKEGKDVTSLQTFLEDKGYLVIPNGIAKGYFGSLTKSALTAYQESVGISPIGIFGPQTRTKVIGEVLQETKTAKATVYTRSLYLGREGQDVSQLQTFLEDNGYLVIPSGIAKGYFGSLTKKALTEYQKSVDISPIGIFGPQTRARVESDLGTTNASVPSENTSSPTTTSNSNTASYTRSLSLGKEGKDVTSLQTFLEDKGYLVIPNGIAKGYFGSLTKSALTAYQESVGISPIGIFGPQTRASVLSN